VKNYKIEKKRIDTVARKDNQMNCRVHPNIFRIIVAVLALILSVKQNQNANCQEIKVTTATSQHTKTQASKPHTDKNKRAAANTTSANNLAELLRDYENKKDISILKVALKINEQLLNRAGSYIHRHDLHFKLLKYLSKAQMWEECTQTSDKFIKRTKNKFIQGEASEYGILCHIRKLKVLDLEAHSKNLVDSKKEELEQVLIKIKIASETLPPSRKAPLLLTASQIHLLLENFSSALTSYSEALKADKEAKGALNWARSLYAALKETKRTIEIEELLEILLKSGIEAPLINNEPVRNQLLSVRLENGISFYKKGNYTKAIPHLKEYAQSSTNTADLETALYTLGLCYLRADEYENSFFTFKKLLTVAPQSKYSADAHLNMGMALFKKKDYNRAFDYFVAAQKGTQNQKNDFKSRLLAADSLAAANRIDEAIANYFSLVEIIDSLSLRKLVLNKILVISNSERFSKARIETFKLLTEIETAQNSRESYLLQFLRYAVTLKRNDLVYTISKRILALNENQTSQSPTHRLALHYLASFEAEQLKESFLKMEYAEEPELRMLLESFRSIKTKVMSVCQDQITEECLRGAAVVAELVVSLIRSVKKLTIPNYFEPELIGILRELSTQTGEELSLEGQSLLGELKTLKTPELIQNHSSELERIIENFRLVLKAETGRE